MPKKGKGKGKGKKGKGGALDEIKLGTKIKQNRLEHEHLYREIKYGAETIRRHEERWRSLVYQLAVPRMCQEAEAFWHAFEYVIDSKDFTISLLLDELQRAEEQYQLLVRAHIDSFDRIVSLWKTQSTALWNDSQHQISNLYKAAVFERNELAQNAKDNEDYLKTTTFALDEAQKELDILTHGANLAQQDVFKTTTQDSLETLMGEMSHKYNTYCAEARAFTEHYNEYFVEQAKKFAGIEEEDDIMSQQIRDDWKHIEASYSQIHYLYDKLDTTGKENEAKYANLMHEYDYFHNIYLAIASQLRQDKNTDLEQLTFLANESSKVIEELVSFEKKGELLLKMVGVCRKMETSNELIQAFPTFELPKKKKKQRIKKIDTASEPDVAKQLELFWNHMASVEVSRYDLTAQCEFLRHENETLRKKVIEYCDCLDCEPQVLFLYENSNLLTKYIKENK